MSSIAITVDGREALTTRQLGEEFLLDPASARTAVRRVGLEPVAHLDDRTPLYDAETARTALRNRPGRGSRSGWDRAAAVVRSVAQTF
ncbi:hypothetical protein [Actinoplanes subglobosus]|uniref:Uncharacterized protein n=1 Tax=Actinoplanes subglobosus TaxID=1547892 RepID=A0ABV8IUM7_9ACTN